MSPKSALINAISVRTGGAETFLTHLLPWLAACLSDWQFHLVVRSSRRQLYTSLPPNVAVEAIPDATVASVVQRLRFEHERVPAMHRHRRYAVHFQADEMLSPRVAWLGVPSLAVYHTTPMVMFDASTGDSRLLTCYARWLRRNTALHCSIPVTVSQHARAELSGLYPFARDRLRVVYHGVDQDRYSPGTPAGDPRHIWGSDRPYLLSISNRFQWKNYYRLIEAYHHALAMGALDCDLVLIGQAKLAAEEERIAQYLIVNGLQARVHMVDYVDQSGLPDVYRAALAYAFPSMRETFGLTVLEAMASGVPVASARWGPLPEVAGDAARYFDPLQVEDIAQALADVCHNPSLRSELARRGLQHVRYFTWERAAQAYARLLVEAAN